MFGYAIADKRKLSSEAKRTYAGFYCGLCAALEERAGALGRMTLTYDMTFLCLILSSCFSAPEKKEKLTCPVHPLRKGVRLTTKFTGYAADMNLLLAWHKADDDVRDEGKGKWRRKKLMRAKEAAERRNPEKAAVIEECLKDLAELEREGESNPDVPANCFGRLTETLFDFGREDLKAFGFALGKAIYLLDACLDFKKDLRACRYNPMMSIPSQDFQQILINLLSDCAREYDSMKLEKYREITDQIIYGGLMDRWESRNAK